SSGPPNVTARSGTNSRTDPAAHTRPPRPVRGAPRRTESTMSPPTPRTPVQNTPVLVLGAGPVGQTTALLLARRGVPVQIVDARPAPEALASNALCPPRDAPATSDCRAPA